MHTRRRLFRHAANVRHHPMPERRVVEQLVANQCEHDFELGVVGRVGVGQRAARLVDVLGLVAFVNQKRRIAAVIDQHVRPIRPVRIRREGQRLQRAPPVLFERLTLPREGVDRARSVAATRCHRRRRMVLRRENVARRPAHLGPENCQRLCEHRRLNRVVQRARDARPRERLRCAKLGTAAHEAGHLMLGKLNLFATKRDRRRAHVAHLVGERAVQRQSGVEKRRFVEDCLDCLAHRRLALLLLWASPTLPWLWQHARIGRTERSTWLGFGRRRAPARGRGHSAGRFGATRYAKTSEPRKVYPTAPNHGFSLAFFRILPHI